MSRHRIFPRPACARALLCMALGALVCAASPSLARAQEGSTAPPGAVQGQPIAEAPPRWQVGGSLALAVPAGEFRDHVNVGGGILGHGLCRLDPGGWLSLKAAGGVVVYGTERRYMPIETYLGLVSAELTTTNSIAMFGVGPRIGVPRGTWRPYLEGGAGFSYFWTQSSVSGYDGTDLYSSKNLSDWVFGWNAGAGMAIALRQGPRPILLDFNLSHRGHANVKYLPPGGITDNGDGTATYHTVEGKADLTIIGVGITFGL
jgi:hypothetical protein